jgi:hypothetical protein
MWKLSVLLLMLAHAVVIQGAPQNATVLAEIAKNSTQPDKNNLLISKSQINSNNTKANEAGVVNNHEAAANEAEDFPVLAPSGDLDLDNENFKYYWMLLVGSSLAIIGLIVFRSFRYLLSSYHHDKECSNVRLNNFRLRRNRAEVRYGRTRDEEEIEPFSKSKWEEDESSENEDEIFDINFLKNTRLQTHNDL